MGIFDRLNSWINGEGASSGASVNPNWTPAKEAALNRAIQDWQRCLDYDDDSQAHEYWKTIQRMKAERDGGPEPRFPEASWEDFENGNF